MKLPIYRALNLIAVAQEEETKEAIFRLYLVDRPYMDKKNFETFEKYYEKRVVKPFKIDNRSEEEIMAEILSIKG